MNKSRLLLDILPDDEHLAINSTASHNKCYVDQEEHLYVNLSTFWYCFLALITTLGLLVSLVSNMIIIYLFSWYV